MRPPADQMARQLSVLDHAERVAGLGSWEWLPATGELRWSDNLFRLFDLEPGALAPTAAYVIERVHPADREHFEASLAQMSAGERRSVEYRITTLAGATRILQATVAAIEAARGAPLRLVGSILDVTERRQLESEVALRVAISSALERWTSAESSGAGLLEAMARALGFDFGALWVPEGERFNLRAMWHASLSGLTGVAAATRGWHPGLGSATVGRAVTTREPIISSEVQASAPPGRARAMRAAGLSCAVAVPATDGSVLAVVELLGREPLGGGDRLRRALEGAGHEIGSFLALRRGELAGAVMTERELAVLQLAARGYGTEEIAHELHLSPATVKRHFERVYARLGTPNRAASVAEAMRRGLID